MKEDSRARTLCQIPELDLGCFGCCGRKYAGKTLLKRDIRINTKRYKETKHEIEDLKDRSKEIRKSGICKFVIYMDEKRVGCPLHPLQNQGYDLRRNHCDIHYLCTTYKEFLSWDREKKEDFLTYIKNKDLDFVDYSRAMAQGSLLRGFKLRKERKFH